MNIKDYISLNLKKGTIHSIHWKRTLSDGDVLKDFKGRIEKETIGNFRIGVDYSNMAINKDKITGSLPYGFFEYSNEIIYSPSTDTYQLRLTHTMNKKMTPTIKYYLDGNEITKQELIDMNALGSKERNPKERLIYNIKLNNIIAIK